MSESTLRRCRVAVAVVADGVSFVAAPGDLVDLATPIGPHVTLADCVRGEWFSKEEANEAVPLAARSIRSTVKGNH